MKPTLNVSVKSRFRLYVAEDMQNSVLAVANLKALCQTYLPGEYEIEIVDVFKEPSRALADRVFITPTLIRLAPLPVRRIVGTLSQPEKLLQALGLGTAAA